MIDRSTFIFEDEMTVKKSRTPSISSREENSVKKSAVTRERIMDAAKRVFAEHEYSAASIRMVAAEGKFGHGIIRYYFANKSELFKAVMSDICAELFARTSTWLDEARHMPLEKGLRSFVENLIEYNEQKPASFRVLVQNMAVMKDPDSTPGHELITKFLVDTRHAFQQKLLSRNNSAMTQRFIDSFNGLVLYYLGASRYQAGILGMDPESLQYRKWVKETLVSVFLPFLKNLVN